jgi:aryl-alcohol dehydrogenase-like predicted oxidoreductase
VIIGAGRPEQIGENLKALKRIDFSDVELEKIETILKS